MDLKYIMFRLENEECAVEIPVLKEVIVNTEVTEVPNTCPFLKGVISLRGTIVPVLDIKKCFGFPENQQRDYRILVIRQNKSLAGIPVDSIEGVEQIPDCHIGAVPAYIGSDRSKYLKGIIKYNNRLVMVLRTSTLIERLKNEN